MGNPKTYKVEWTQTAGADLAAFVEFIARDSIASAPSVLNRIEQRAETLTTQPKRGRKVPELTAIGIPMYRELIVSPWRIVYRTAGNTVYILAVMDGRRNLEDVLLERFLR
jgi:plasmid stabilization system protein ParE